MRLLFPFSYSSLISSWGALSVGRPGFSKHYVSVYGLFQLLTLFLPWGSPVAPARPAHTLVLTIPYREPLGGQGQL